jgi:hypothetical protein
MTMCLGGPVIEPDQIYPSHHRRRASVCAFAALLLAALFIISTSARAQSFEGAGTMMISGAANFATSTLTVTNCVTFPMYNGPVGYAGLVLALTPPTSYIGAVINIEGSNYVNTYSAATNLNMVALPSIGLSSVFLDIGGQIVFVSNVNYATSPQVQIQVGASTPIWSSGDGLLISNSITAGTLIMTNVVLLNPSNSTFSTLSIPTLNFGGGILTNAVGVPPILNVQNGRMVINSGTTTVGALYVTNSANDVLNFNAGTLTSLGSIISNGVRFVVGDGTNGAILNLSSGSHTFADGVTIGANALLTNSATLNTPSMIINGSGQFTMNGGLAVVNIVTNSGTFIQSGGLFDPAFYHNTGLLQITGGTNQDTVFLNDVAATVQHSGGQHDVSVATNFGSWTVSGTAVANLTNFINKGGGTLSIAGGTLNTSLLIASNAGNVLTFSAGLLRSGGSTVSNGTAFVVGDGVQSATLDLLGGTHSFADGLMLSTNSSLIGSGSIIAGSATNFGIIAPGHSAGTLTFSGDLTLKDSSVLNMELGGTNSGAYDMVFVGGLLRIGGLLNVNLTNDYTGVIGDTFDLFNFGSVTGTFSQTNLPTLSAGMGWETSKLYTLGEIQIVPEPGISALMLAGAGAFCLRRRRR